MRPLIHNDWLGAAANSLGGQAGTSQRQKQWYYT